MKRGLLLHIFIFLAVVAQAQLRQRMSHAKLSLDHPSLPASDRAFLRSLDSLNWTRLASKVKPQPGQPRDTLFRIYDYSFSYPYDESDIHRKYSKKKPPAADVFELALDWNAAADSVMMKGFCRAYALSYATGTGKTQADTAPVFRVRFDGYENFLGAADDERWKRIVRGQVLRLLDANGAAAADGSFTTTLYLRDSLDLLPQYPAWELLYTWGDGPGRGPSLSLDKDRKTQLSIAGFDSLYTSWDSLNVTEDPNNRDNWVIAPLKQQVMPLRAKFVYRWSPFEIQGKRWHEANMMLHGYRRVLESIVLEYKNAPPLYLDPHEAIAYAKKVGLRYEMYEEQLRALIYRQARIETW